MSGVGAKSSTNTLEPTIFHEAWWLEAVSNGTYQEARCFENGSLVGRFPYVLKRSRLGLTVCQAPPLTHFLGPAVDIGSGAYCNRTLRRDRIIRELLRQVPAQYGFSHTLHHGISDVILFQEQGFEALARFTYEILPVSIDRIWLDMRDKTRNVIRRAQEHVEVVEIRDSKTFFDVYNRNIASFGYRNSYDADLVESICVSILDKNRGKMLGAKNASGTIEACIMYVWDQNRSYYLMSSRSRDAHNGSVSLMVWEAIKHSCDKSIIFDFDGVGTQGARLFFSGFGGRVSPRYKVQKFSTTHQVLNKSEAMLANFSKQLLRMSHDSKRLD